MISKNSSVVLASLSLLQNSGSISITINLESISRCKSPSRGAAIIKSMSVGLPSGASYSIPFGAVIAASPAFFTLSLFAWGTAIPSPIAVVP